MLKRFPLFVILAICVVFAASPSVRAQCQPTFSSISNYVPFDSISYIAGPNEAGDYLVVGLMSVTNFGNLNTVPLPNATNNNRFCDTVPLSSTASYFAYVPTVAERGGDFSAFNGMVYDLTADCSPFPACALYPGGRIPLPGTDTNPRGVFAWRIPAGETVFVSNGPGRQILKD